MSLEKDELDFWLFPEVFARIIASLAIISILSDFWLNSPFKKIILPILIIVFILWAFRPFFIAIKNFKLPPKKKSIDKKQILYEIFCVVNIFGFILLINRFWFSFLPSSQWRILADHLIGGFLIPIWLFILFLGIRYFSHPEKKIAFKMVDFWVASAVIIITILCWEGFVQKFRDISQILADLFGLILACVFFINYKKSVKK